MSRRFALSVAVLAVAIAAAAAAVLSIGSALLDRRADTPVVLQDIDRLLASPPSGARDRRLARLLRRAGSTPPSAEFAASVVKRALQILPGPGRSPQNTPTEARRQETAYGSIAAPANAYSGNSMVRLLAAYAAYRVNRPLVVLGWIHGVADSPAIRSLAVWAASQLTGAAGRATSWSLPPKWRAAQVERAWNLSRVPAVAAWSARAWSAAHKPVQAATLAKDAGLAETAPWFALLLFAEAGEEQLALETLRSHRAELPDPSAAAMVEAELLLSAGLDTPAAAQYLDVWEQDGRQSALLNHAWVMIRSPDPSERRAGARAPAHAAADHAELETLVVHAAAYLTHLTGQYHLVPATPSDTGDLAPLDRLTALKLSREFDRRGYDAAVWALALSEPEVAFEYAAWYFYRSGKLDELRRLLALTPHQPGAAFYRGLIDFEEESWVAAAASFEQALELDPSWHAAYNAALARINGGDRARALELFGVADSLAAGLPAAVVTIAVTWARTYASLGRDQDAAAVVRGAERRVPDTDAMRLHSATVETAR